MMNTHSPHPLIGSDIQSSRRAFSLLEVVLALGLSVVLFAAITAAIQLNLSGLTKQRIRIERKQIARASLAMMANDLRAGIQYKAADFSGLDNLVKSQSMMLGSLMGAEGTEEVPNEEVGSEVYDEELVSYRPLFLGTEMSVMLDISRMPRLDQYNPLVASSQGMAQTPSDIKSIAYFVSLSDGGIQTEVQFSPTVPGGLYRREIDRAVAAYMGDVGMPAEPDIYSQLVSSEIAQLNFRYFDGADWLTNWNSEEQGGFPLAIEITIVIDPARTSANNQTYSFTGYDQQTMEQYRQVVHLPVSEPIIN
jgi:type II secretory pathway pseudopilin PulG